MFRSRAGPTDRQQRDYGRAETPCLVKQFAGSRARGCRPVAEIMHWPCRGCVTPPSCAVHERVRLAGPASVLIGSRWSLRSAGPQRVARGRDGWCELDKGHCFSGSSQPWTGLLPPSTSTAVLVQPSGGLSGFELFEASARILNVWKVLFAPVTHGGEGFGDRVAEVGQGVFDLWRPHLSEDVAVHESVLFEFAERLSEHFLGDAGDCSAELSESVGFVFESADDECRPL